MALRCPRCQENHSLRKTSGPQGTVVDICTVCLGVWFDQGEILNYSKAPHRLAEELKKPLLQEQTKQGLNCPRCEIKMSQGGLIDPTLLVDRCSQCEGMWFDKGEVQKMQKLEQTKRWTQFKETPQDFHRETEKKEIVFPSMLPSLWLRASFTFLFLYGLLTLGIIILVEANILDQTKGFLVVVAMIALNFILSPFLMDFFLKMGMSARWVKKEELPAHLREFVERVSAYKGISFPHFAIIKDGNPNAFTYGHTPKNARIAITQGLLDICDEREVEAVVAHEMGHIAHWDMMLMTAASIVPIFLYYVYRTLVRNSSEKKGASVLIGVGAYLLYVLAEYAVLFFSRVREYHADRFAGEVTGEPSALASALIKIAYGLAVENEKNDRIGSRSDSKERKYATVGAGSGGYSNVSSIRSLGIFDLPAAKLAVAGAMGNSPDPKKIEMDPEALLDPMQWDLWNPWGTYYELASTHPLPAKRIQALAQQSLAMDQKPFAVFDRQKPESYWDEFFVDLFFHILPVVGFLAGMGTLLYGRFNTKMPFLPALGYGLIVWGLSLVPSAWFKYRGRYFPSYSIAGLLKKIKVSAIRPVPATVQGKLIGRGVPGLVWSEDMVIRDQTGLLFLDYQQPLGIWNFFFGLFRQGEFSGKQIVAEGWYRRSPMPYLEIRRYKIAGTEEWNTCYSWMVTRVFPFVLMALGAYFSIFFS